MKRKELKNLAKKIAKAELIAQNSSDTQEVSRAKDEIMKLSGHINKLEDMVLLDDYVQEFLKEDF